MKTIILKSFLITLIATLFISNAIAQRIISGTVYREGKPAAGVTVEAQKSSDLFMTSFDGKYKLEISDKTKLLKFTFIDDVRKLDIEGNSDDVINFSFDGVIPEEEEKTDGVNLQSQQELINAGDKEFLSSLSIYNEFYKQKDYKSAMQPWRKLYHHYPKSTINIYIHGTNMYESYVENSKDPKIRDLYIDSLMHVYDKRIKYFNQKGYVLGRQGIDYLKYKIPENNNLSEDKLIPILKKGYNMLEQSIQLQGEETESPVLLVFMQTTRGLFNLSELSSEKVVENYDKASKIIAKHLKDNPTDADVIIIRDYIDQIFQNCGAADCETLIATYTPRFDEIASDIEGLKKMLRVLEKQDCTDSELFAKASEKLYSLEPSAEAAFNMARMFVKREHFEKAKEYYKQAIESETDKELLAKYYYELALFIFAKENDPIQARSYARKSIENDPNFAKSYILIGDIYAHSSKSFGENDFEHQTVYWLAVDYYIKAKNANPDSANIANEKISIYSKYFPDKETIFFNLLGVGDQYRLEGWINETTTVREKK